MTTALSPLISIITITFNSEKYLPETIRSIKEQDYKHIEFIVVDGSSTDSTLNIIKNNSDIITRWISEPDNGIADAMNKGLSLCSGEYILFLHSDDALASPDSISKAAGYFDNKHYIYAFNIIYGSKSKHSAMRPRGFNFWFNFKTGIFHQGAICHKSVFEKIGFFNTTLLITMDYDFFLRAYHAGYKLKKCDHELSFMRDSGISSQKDWGSIQNRITEERRTHKLNNTSLFMKLIYAIYWSLYPVYRKLLNTS